MSNDHPCNAPNYGKRRTPTRFVLGFAVCGIVWLVLTGWRMEPMIIGFPSALLAASLYARLQPAGTVMPHPLALLRFLAYFLRASLLAGVDIAIRVLAPRVRVAPGFLLFETCLKRSDARIFFANTVSLIPGTLSVRFEGDRLHVHTIDIHEPTEANLRQLESLLAALFREATVNQKDPRLWM